MKTCTLLKDIKGKMLYEGDNVKTWYVMAGNSDKNVKKTKGIVKRVPGGFVIRGEDGSCYPMIGLVRKVQKII